MSIDLKLSLFKSDFSNDEFLSEFLEKKDNHQRGLEELKKILVQANNNIEDLLREIAALKYAPAKPIEDENDLLTIKEVAYILKCSSKSVHRYIKTLDLKVIQLSKRNKAIPRYEIQRITCFITPAKK